MKRISAAVALTAVGALAISGCAANGGGTGRGD
jgi:peptide/nickel transport system substrate-binding protein